jgi:hypothetical protein
MNYKPAYRYRLKKLDAGSEKYGKCEMCKKTVRGKMYTQVEEKSFISSGRVHWARTGDAFGHKSCLMEMRK